MCEYYEYFSKIASTIDVKKLVDEFFAKYGKEILRNWDEEHKFCIEEDYNTAQCDEYLVAADMAREIVQPLYDLVEKIENEIKTRLLMLFLFGVSGLK